MSEKRIWRTFTKKALGERERKKERNLCMSAKMNLTGSSPVRDW